MRNKLLLAAASMGLVSCGLLGPKEESVPFIRTTQVQKDGTTVVIDTPVVDAQDRSHATATVNLFSE